MAIWCLGCFVTTASGLGNALGYFVQAKVYNEAPIRLSYSVRFNALRLISSSLEGQVLTFHRLLQPPQALPLVPY